METKNKIETKKEVTNNEVTKNKIDLNELLNQTNQKNAIHKIARKKGNKYQYPDELKELKSTDKNKKRFRKQLQNNLLTFLSIDNPTKENLNDFQNFINAFFINAINIKNCNDVTQIYSFDESNKKEIENATLILNKYKKL